MSSAELCLCFFEPGGMRDGCDGEVAEEALAYTIRHALFACGTRLFGTTKIELALTCLCAMHGNLPA